MKLLVSEYEHLNRVFQFASEMNEDPDSVVGDSIEIVYTILAKAEVVNDLDLVKTKKLFPDYWTNMDMEKGDTED